jgi:hypothetical protein
LRVGEEHRGQEAKEGGLFNKKSEKRRGTNIFRDDPGIS